MIITVSKISDEVNSDDVATISEMDVWKYEKQINGDTSRVDDNKVRILNGMVLKRQAAEVEDH